MIMEQVIKMQLANMTEQIVQILLRGDDIELRRDGMGIKVIEVKKAVVK